MRALYPVLPGIAYCAFFLSSPIQTLAQDSSAAAGKSSESSARFQEVSPVILSSASIAELPDSPGTTLLQLQQEESSSAPSQTQNAETSTTAQNSQQQNQPLQRPVGAAAAEAPKVSGITAAQPAGVAIAPGKQRRIRTIVLKVGAIVGGAAALGTVIALTAATPSKPPGAH